MNQETIDYIAIQRIQSRYADIVTRRAWQELHEIFRPDIRVVIDTMDGNHHDLVGPDGVADFISDSIAHFDFFEFVILNTVIDIRGDEASARMYMCELRHDPVGGRSTAFGLYRDEYGQVDGEWRFTHRRYRSVARTMSHELAVFGFPTD